ncbi:hypothetical protein FQN51_003715 [Onygenales sp. PD_10]|nr:hypothetical protein FQN51_003715 [Onygenales sp. PD_10]
MDQKTSEPAGAPGGHDNAVPGTRRTPYEIDKYWSSVVTEEPISKEMRELVRADLREAWHYHRDINFRQNVKHNWYYEHLTAEMGDPVDVKPCQLPLHCNKPTASYWLQTAQLKKGGSGKRSLIEMSAVAGIYNEWALTCQGGWPDIDHGHFIANPIRITETGPKTVKGVLDAHKALCTQASSLLQSTVPSRELEYRSIQPLYHAIVIIQDRDDRTHEMLGERPWSLHKYSQLRTVLVARTGMEEGLSAPISLEGLRSQSLPLGPSDIFGDGVDVVRVSLAAAVRFVVSLEEREKLATSKKMDDIPVDMSLGPPAPEGFPDHVAHSPESWADALIANADKQGYDNVRETWMSIRRIQSAAIGEDFGELKDDYVFGHRWKE